MFRLEKKLEEWNRLGFITGAQQTNIIDYEKSHKSNIAVYSVIALGAIAICIGIVSLIAFNWKDIPDMLKLGADFLILSVLGYLSYFFAGNPEKRGIFDAITVSYFLMIAASIGLISQIYNTGGELYQAATFWAIIALPFVIFSNGILLLHLWVLVALGALTGQLDSRIKEFRIVIQILLIFIPQVLFFIGVLIHRYMKPDAGSIRLSQTSLFWATFLSISASISLSVDSKSTVGYESELIVGSGFLLFLGGILLSSARGKLRNLLLISFTIFSLLVTHSVFAQRNDLIEAILFILFWFSLSFVFYNIGYKSLFNFFIIGIGIRFLVVYFQVFGNLATTGFGLIFSGLLIIGVCVFYIKKRESIEQILEQYL